MQPNDSPIYFWAAYQIARAQVVAAVRKEQEGSKLDLVKIQNNIDALVPWISRLAELVSKASTIQRNGQAIETTLGEFKADLQARVNDVLCLLSLPPAENTVNAN